MSLLFFGVMVRFCYAQKATSKLTGHSTINIYSADKVIVKDSKEAKDKEKTTTTSALTERTPGREKHIKKTANRLIPGWFLCKISKMGESCE